MTTTATIGQNLQPAARTAKVRAGEAQVQRLLDLELSVRGESRRHAARQSLFDDDRSPARRVARLRNGRVFGRGCSCRESPGTLELFHLSLVNFQNAVEEATGNAVAVYQRVDQAGQRLPLDERIFADTDTLMIFGLDHMVAEEEASQAEIAALEEFLSREGTCLILGPHHDVGSSSDLKVRDMEYYHHGDPLVPRQQRFAKYVRGLMKGLGTPVENRHGLRPATHPGTTRPVPIVAANDLDTRGWLTGVLVVRVPHAPAALRAYGREPQRHPRARPSADRSVEAAPVHRGRQPRDQHVPVDAARRANARATSCSRTRRSSRRSSAAMRA